MREPDEVRGSVIGVVAVQMMTLMVEATGTDPSDSDKKMTIRVADEAAHAWVIRMIVRLASEVLRQVGFVWIQTSGREGVEQPFLRAVQFPVARTRYHPFAKPQFSAIGEIDDLRRQYVVLHTVTF